MSNRDEEMEALMRERDPSFERIFECVLGVREHETKTFFALAERPGSTVDELASALERDRSNVNRSLQSLVKCGVVERERRLLEGGGYAYQYYPVDLTRTKEHLHGAVDAWAEDVHGRIEEFGE